MARPHKCRRVAAEPATTCFKPAGVPARSLQAIDLRVDELETLRLADLEGLYHDEAANRMDISRATFGRLLESARRKVADALVNGLALEISGGEVMFDMKRQFICSECGGEVSLPRGTGRPGPCPHCGKASLRRVGVAVGDEGERPGRCRRAGKQTRQGNRIRNRSRNRGGSERASTAKESSS